MRWRPETWLLLAFCMLVAGWCAASPTPAARTPRLTVGLWSMDQGLPHNLVHAVEQAADGQVWVGTWEGVARFDGRDFTVFDRQNTPGAELSGVFAIARDRDGGMLFGTVSDGVFRYHLGVWEQLGDAAARRLQAAALLRDADGALWVGTRHSLYRIGTDGTLADIGPAAALPPGGVTALMAVDDGLLVGTEHGLYRLPRDGGKARAWGGATGMGGAAVRRLAPDQDGGLLVAGDDGVWWRHRDGRLEHLHAGERVISVLQDRRGQLWMGFASGRLLRQVPGQPAQRVAVGGVVSPALLEGAEGLIWAGSTLGLWRIAEGAAHGVTTSEGLGSDYVRAVLETADGTVWAGHAAGLSRINGAAVEPVALGPGTDAAASPSVLALAAANGGGIWAGTYDQGVLRVAGDGAPVQRIGQQQGLPSPFVRALLQDPDGGLWIGTNAGLAHYRAGTMRTYGIEDGLVQGAIQVLYRDRRRTLWIGSDQGMAAIDAAGKVRQWRSGDGFPAQNVFDFLDEGNGELWVASDRGLLRLRGEAFTVYDHRVGLPRDKLFRIIDDGKGHFWLSSNRGVFRIARRDFDDIDAGRRRQLAVEVVDRSDGLPSSQANGSSSPAGWLARSGALLFPTSAGLGIIDPDGIGARQPRPVPIVFERVTADGLAQPAGERYRFAAGTQRVAIGYAGLNFQAPDKVRYRYRMHGFDPDWVDAGDGTQAVYTNLAPGSYRFEVQAMALPVDWSRSGAAGSAGMALELVPPWWRRPGVLAAAALAAAGLLIGFYFWRTASYRQRQRHLGKVIAARTRELSDKNLALLAADRERGELMRKLEHQASHDVLTGLSNRREAERFLQQALAQAQADGDSLAVALLDIDHFKRINDAHGHEVGDAVLRGVGAELESLADEQLFAARYGGEEFLLVMRGLSAAQAQARVQALLLRLRGLVVQAEDARVCCTASAGLAVSSRRRRSARELLVAADRQLYEAKRGGRDRLSVAQD